MRLFMMLQWISDDTFHQKDTYNNSFLRNLHDTSKQGLQHCWKWFLVRNAGNTANLVSVCYEDSSRKYCFYMCGLRNNEAAEL
jgi:hypothetical protein